MAQRIVMLVDFDYFFAQAEEIRNPLIREKPVVVCVYSGRSEDSGAVSTANYIARKYGVRSGMPIFRAKRLLENSDAVFLPVDHAYYEDISARAMSVLRGYADQFEQVGIDETYLDVTERTGGSFEEAALLAGRAKDEIKLRLSVRCSIGIGPNKLLAKIAADSQKPDGVTTVKPEQTETFLFPLPIGRLIGVGTKTKEKMQNLGVSTIGDLAKCPIEGLIRIFGRSLGAYFHNASRGIDHDLVKERGEAESVSRISTLKQDTRDLGLILEKTHQLCGEISIIISEQKLTFKTIGIIAVMSDMSISTRSKTFADFVDNVETLEKTVKALLERVLAETRIGVRRVGVRISNFAKGQKTQQQLTGFLESTDE